jgi:hypothetical protein
MALVSLATLCALSQAVSVDAPVSAVTVYSDRARVVRSAKVGGSGARRVEIVVPQRADPASIRVEADGAQVTRVEIARLDEAQLPADEARKLIAGLETLDDKLARNRAEHDAWAAQLGAARSLKPRLPEPEGTKPRPKLNPAGWMQVTAWSGTWMEKAQAELRRLDDAQRAMSKQRGPLVEKARLLGGAERRTGWRVVPTLEGGEAKLRVSYEISGARWYPSYDIQLHPETGRVEIHFAGEVSQETGEDWSDAALTLSTAVPAASTRLPRLHTWKVGERERFVPAPPRVNDPVRPPPRALPPARASRDEDEKLRVALLERAGATQPTLTPPSQDSEREQAETIDGKNDERDDRDGDTGRTVDVTKTEQQIELAMKPAPTVAAAPPPAEVVMESVTTVARGRHHMSYAASAAPAAPEPTEQIGLLPPPGWRAPTWDPNLPAALAGGWDLSYAALAPETIASGKGTRRVALFARSWPVTAERKLFPALADEAFLIAEIKNPSQEALPGGRAQLFVGADPAGTAMLAMVAPGETFTLPLGLDHAVKPVRNVKVTTVEKGIINKDEINEYVVTTEIANPYRSPLLLRVLDQIPVTDQHDVEVKLLRTEPAAQIDAVKGELAWRVTVPPSGRTAVTFTYSLKRPKGWRLHQ